MLFTWMRTRRAARRSRERGQAAARPADRAVRHVLGAPRRRAPSAISSSLDQNVPSKNTQSAPSSAARTAGGQRRRRAGKYARRAPGARLAEPKPDVVLGDGVLRRPSRWSGSLPGHRHAPRRGRSAAPPAPSSSSSRPSSSGRQVDLARESARACGRARSLGEAAAHRLGRVDRERLRLAQRRSPRQWSRSPLVRTMPGDRRVRGARGWSGGKLSICGRTSGEAFSRNQSAVRADGDRLLRARASPGCRPRGPRGSWGSRSSTAGSLRPRPSRARGRASDTPKHHSPSALGPGPREKGCGRVQGRVVLRYRSKSSA